MRLHLVAPPAIEPLTPDDVARYRRVDEGLDEETLSDLTVSAREMFEEETGRQVITATWRLELSRFPSGRTPLVIPKAPLLAVSEVAYLDSSGASQVWSASEYDVKAYAGPYAANGMIYPGAGYYYPTTLWGAPDAVTVTFTAGYGSTSGAVPQSVRSTIQALIGDLYEHREATVTGTIVSELPSVQRALNRFRIPVYA